MILSSAVVGVLSSGAKRLHGAEKRQYMAEAVHSLGRGAQRACEKQLGWCRNTIRKGWHELKSGINCLDNYSARGRKKCEEKNPKLLGHIKKIIESSLQADPAMNSERIYVKMSCNEIRKQLKKQFHYPDKNIPSEGAMRRILNENNYFLRKVRKTIPKKKDT